MTEVLRRNDAIRIVLYPLPQQQLLGVKTQSVNGYANFVLVVTFLTPDKREASELQLKQANRESNTLVSASL